jgi:tetratricopeptide (TPR) repeat protein
MTCPTLAAGRRRGLWLLLGALAVFPPPLQAQRFKLAAKLDQLERVARKDSNDAAAHFNVALGYWNAKRWDDVEGALQRAVAIEPQFAEAYLALSRLVLARHPRLWDDIREARVPDDLAQVLSRSAVLWRRAFMLDPLVNLRIEAAVRPPRSVYWTVTEQLNKTYDYWFGGFDELLEGRYASAYGRWDRIVRDTPNAFAREQLPDFIYYYRGLSAAHAEKWQDAIDDFTLLLDRELKNQHPDSLVYYLPHEVTEYRYMLAFLQDRAGARAVAVRLYREALEHDLGFYPAHIRLADIAESNRRWDEAVAERQRAVSANPDDPSLMLDLGMTLARAGRLAEAAATLREAMDANPRDTRVPYYLGVVSQQLSRAGDARVALTRFISLAPSRYDRQVQDAKQRLAALP